MIADTGLGVCLCRAHHYPPTAPDAAGCTRGVGAHTDFGALTLLLQDAGELSQSIGIGNADYSRSGWFRGPA